MDQPPPFPEPLVRPARRGLQVPGPSLRVALALACAGVLAAALLGALVSAKLAALTIAATLAVAGAWRAAAPRTEHAVGIAVRSKTLDVVMYFGTAAVIAFLALTVPYLG